MHFHLPKPLHGWREFAGEVGIIVFGVLIALAFEAVVDHLSWNSKVDEARTELRHELGHNLALLDKRIAQQDCVARRLAELGPIITGASASGRLPPLGIIYGPGHYTWPTSVRDSQIAAQTVTHFPAQESAAISRVYRYVSMMHDDNDAEEQAWDTLNAMAGPGRPIDGASISRLIEALDEARTFNGAFASDKKKLETVLIQAGLGRDFPQVDPANPPVLDSAKPLICQPIGKPPSTY